MDQGPDFDAEIVHSIRAIKAQRTNRLIGVVVGIALGIAALFGATYLAYADDADMQEKPSAPAK